MGRFGGIRTAFLAPALVVGLTAATLSGCSSGKKSTPSTTSTTASTATTTSTTAAVPSTSSTTVPPTTAPTTSASTTPSTGPPGVRITGFTISPAAPVCNSPTMIQVAWTASGASAVDLSIDGRKFASYAGGAQSHLEYFACDGKAHTYLLTAHGPGGGLAIASKVVRSTATG